MKVVSKRESSLIKLAFSFMLIVSYSSVALLIGSIGGVIITEILNK